MGYKKIVAHELSDYDKNPDVFVKFPYCPGFGPRSLTWLVWYFYYQSPRKKIRIYESYGRTEEEALKGLKKAVRKKVNFIPISKQKYLELKKRKK